MSEFERFNLIYGWNGCGKTTLSKLFAALPKGGTDEFRELSYSVESGSGFFSEGSEFDLKIKVFNQDYVLSNIELVSGTAKPIFILGEENKKIAEEIRADEAALKELIVQKKAQEEIEAATERSKNNKFTDIARVIGSNSAGSSVRTYRRNNAEAAFSKLKSKSLLTIDGVNRLSGVLKQEQKAPLNPITIPTVSLGERTVSVLEFLVYQTNIAKELCLRTVESILIERLSLNSDISEWVELGLKLHDLHKSDKCEFCNGMIPENRLSALTQHFNEADQHLKDSVDDTINQLDKCSTLFDSIRPVDVANLYPEFQDEYKIATGNLEKEQSTVKETIEELKAQLLEKKQKTTKPVSIESFAADPSLIEGAVKSLNNVIEKQNATTTNFTEAKGQAESGLETHYLSDIYDEVKDLEGKLSSCREQIEVLTNGSPTDVDFLGIENLKNRIVANQAKISSEHKACDVLNKQVATFLGHGELRFEVVTEGGYVIKRRGKIAKNLSEGEKTAIAFVYFVVHLQDKDFDIENGVIVIDDPISSLDSNSLFQAFAFLKSAVINAKQVFIFTHNFDFMRLLIGWMDNIRKSAGKKRLLMVTNKFTPQGERFGLISELDPMLRDYETEYQYLFKKLFLFESDGTIENVYHVPNLARKTLETFLMFRVPNKKSMYSKLETLDFDEVKKTGIYKFTNDQSHLTGGGFDPAIVPETQNNVRHILELMEAVSPEHYEILKDSISAAETA